MGELMEHKKKQRQFPDIDPVRGSSTGNCRCFFLCLISLALTCYTEFDSTFDSFLK